MKLCASQFLIASKHCLYTTVESFPIMELLLDYSVNVLMNMIVFGLGALPILASIFLLDSFMGPLRIKLCPS